MKSHLLLMFCFVFSILIMGCDSERKDNAQPTYDIVTFIDGKTIKREPLINSCIVAMVQGKNQEMFVNGGLNYCNCFVDKISDTYTYTEYMKLSSEIHETQASLESKAYKLFNIPEIAKIAGECFEDPSNINQNIKMEISSPEMMEMHILQCKEEVRQGSSIAEYNEFIEIVNIDDFCSCYMQKVFTEFTVKQMDYLDQPLYLKRVEQIQEQCVFDNLK